MRIRKVIFVLAGLMVLAVLVYQIPAVKTRWSWRLEVASTFMRGVLNPVGELPTPISYPTLTSVPTATPTPIPTQTPGPTATLIPSPTPLPSSASLPAPEWEKQDINNCGPATLSLYLRYYGWDGDQFDISQQIKPERADRNVNVEELSHFARNYAGWLRFEFRVSGDIQLLKQFLAAGIPVMVEEGYMLEESYYLNGLTDDRWAGHYLLLTAYDDAAGTFTAQDTFKGPDQQLTYQQLDDGWKAFNRVYILVFQPSQEELVKSILGLHWDEDYNRQAALESAQAEADANSGDAYAWFNVGSNLVYFERYAEAAQAYDTARNLGLPQRMLRYQFGPFFAYFHSLRTEELLALTAFALRVTPNSEEALLWNGWGLYRQGDDAGAIENFQEAYWVNPLSPDASYALDFMGASP
ncbi:MAG: hypothetical protein FVQ83_14095 [Chloroflexi bacterium]|nr:hypothetical protein [Chloroflexota bacterium]